MLQRNIFGNYLGRIWTAGITLAFIPLYIRYLGVEAFGLVGFFTMLYSALSILNIGITPTLTREAARYRAGAHSAQSIHNLLRTLEIVCATIALIIALMIWTGSGSLGSHWIDSKALSHATVSHAVGLIGLVCSLKFCETIYQGCLMGLQRQVLFSSLNALFVTLSYGGCAVVLVFFSPTIEAFFAWQAFVGGIRLIAMMLAVRRCLERPPNRPVFSIAEISKVWRFSTGMLGISVLSMMLMQSDKILLSKLISLHDFGIYSVAGTAASNVAQVISPLVMALYPKLVEFRTRSNERGFTDLYHLGSQAVTVLLAPVIGTMIFFPQGLLFVWTGNEELARDASSVLALLTVGTTMNALIFLPYNAMLAHGWTSLTIKFNAVAVLLLIPALCIFVPRYGAIGGATVWAALNATYLVAIVPLMHRRILRSERTRWYKSDVLAPLLGPIGIGSCALLIEPSGGRLIWALFLAGIGTLALLASLSSASLLRQKLLHRFY